MEKFELKSRKEILDNLFFVAIKPENKEQRNGFYEGAHYSYITNYIPLEEAYTAQQKELAEARELLKLIEA